MIIPVPGSETVMSTLPAGFDDPALNPNKFLKLSSRHRAFWTEWPWELRRRNAKFSLAYFPDDIETIRSGRFFREVLDRRLQLAHHGELLLFAHRTRDIPKCSMVSLAPESLCDGSYGCINGNLSLVSLDQIKAALSESSDEPFAILLKRTV